MIWYDRTGKGTEIISYHENKTKKPNILGMTFSYFLRAYIYIYTHTYQCLYYENV